MENEQQVYTKPELTRTDACFGDRRMTLDELHIPKPQLRRHEPSLNIFEFNNNNHNSNEPSTLRRERPSDYGMFPQYFEDDVLSWFNTISNQKKAHYIKYLTDSIVCEDINPHHKQPPILERTQTSIFSNNPYSLEPEPRPNIRLGASAPRPNIPSGVPAPSNSAFNQPFMTSVSSSVENRSHSPVNVASSILHSDMDDEYSDDDFHTDDPLEQSFHHHESIEMEIAENIN